MAEADSVNTMQLDHSLIRQAGTISPAAGPVQSPDSEQEAEAEKAPLLADDGIGVGSSNRRSSHSVTTAPQAAQDPPRLRSDTYYADLEKTPNNSEHKIAQGIEDEYASPTAREITSRMAESVSSFVPPVEIAIETTSKLGARIIFTSWYLALLFALILQAIVYAQWDCSNVCDGAPADLLDFSGWSSNQCSHWRNYTIVENETTTAGNSDSSSINSAALSGTGGPGAAMAAGIFAAQQVQRHNNLVLDSSGGSHGSGSSVSSASSTSSSSALSTAAPTAQPPTPGPDFSYPSSTDGRTEGFIDVVWLGGFSSVFDSHLNRFVHFVFDCPTPPLITETTTYELNFVVQLENITYTYHHNPSDGNGETKEIKEHIDVSSFTQPMTCSPGTPRCTTITVATEDTRITNGSVLILTLRNPPLDLINASLHAAVGSVYQKSGYTLASLSLRYIMMFFGIIITTRFIFGLLNNKTNGREWLYEQTWVLILEGGFLLYMNPFIALCVYSPSTNGFLEFLEYRIPLYYIASFVAFMFALIASCQQWAKHDTHHPPWGAKLICFLFILLIIILDITDVGLHDWDWGMDHCANLECGFVGYMFYGTFVMGVLVCAFWLRWLTKNLGVRPYLSCRPQQLALRLFIFLFSTYIAYFLLSAAIIAIFYRQISGIVVSSTSTQIGPCVVAFTFVSIMAYAYTSMNRNHRRVPIHASNILWKQVVWPTSWFQWVSIHGGATYIFYSEEEELQFNKVQKEYATRPKFFDGADYDPYEAFEEKMRLQELAGGKGASNGSQDTSPFSENGTTRFSFQNRQNRRKSNTIFGGRQMSDASIDNGPVEGNTILDKEDGGASMSTLGRIGTTILHAPGAIIESVEYKIVSTAVSALHLDRRKPFFNLESCMDCFNLSWEAYGVVESLGDAQVITGINVTIPTCFCCLKAEEEGDDSESDLLSTTDRSMESMHDPLIRSSDYTEAVALANSTSTNTGTQKNRHTLYDPNAATPPPRQAAGEQHQANVVSPRDESLAMSPSALATSGPSSTGDNGSGTPSPSTYSNPASPVSMTKKKKSGTNMTQSFNTALTMNVEQYGYLQLHVLEALAVQVVISELNQTQVEGNKRRTPRVVIAFRGTDNVSNAVHDLKFLRVSWPEMQSETWQEKRVISPAVQDGWLEVWNALRDPILEKLTEIIHTRPDHEIYVTGHSMGGAVACLCAYTLQKRLRGLGHEHCVPTVYTFGCPRVGNSTFADEYNKKVPRTFRVVNESDAVSSISIHGGSHVGTEIIVDRFGNFLVEPMYIERAFRPMKGKGSAVSHHGLESYGTSLNAVVDQSHLGVCPVRALVPYFDGPRLEEMRSFRRTISVLSPNRSRTNTATVADLNLDATSVLI